MCLFCEIPYLSFHFVDTMKKSEYINPQQYEHILHPSLSLKGMFY